MKRREASTIAKAVLVKRLEIERNIAFYED